MTDDRPEPKYGQYAPIPPDTEPKPVAVSSPPPPPAPKAGKAPAAPNRARDIIITTVLLLLGVFDVVSAFATFADLGPTLTEVYGQLGITGASTAALAAPLGFAINVVRISVFAVTVVVSLVLIERHRRAFWVPIAGFLVAGITSSVLLGIVMLNDPTYQAWAAQYQ
ncbi:MAG: hypothetical protein KF761_02370 [Salinibacterium sp.]|nr:hypothetical protein [Salinibacterium sp.]